MGQTLIVLLIVAGCAAFLIARALPKPGQSKKACGGGCDNCGSGTKGTQVELVEIKELSSKRVDTPTD